MKKRTKGNIYYIIANYHIRISAFVFIMIIIIELMTYNSSKYRAIFIYPAVYLLGAFFSIVIISRSIRGYLEYINQLITGYSRSEEFLALECEGPDELIEIVDNFEKMKEEAAAARCEARRIEESRSRLMADISHDLCSPITVINGFIKLYKQGVLPKDKIPYVLDIIEKKNAEMAELLEILHEYNVVNHPEFPMNLSVVNISEFTLQYFREREEEIRISGMRLHLNIEDNIYCHFDQTLIRRLYQNLIDNVVKYNGSGTKITVALYHEDDRAVISFSDTGKGIDICIKQQLFEPFIKRGIEDSKSTGLGMAIVQKIVHEHGGNIRLEKSENERGTKYLIMLPSLGKRKNS